MSSISDKQNQLKENNKKTSASKDEQISANKNNHKLADLAFHCMTACIFFGSYYLYKNLNPYMEKVTSMNPNYDFPAYSDYLISIVAIPFYIV